MSTDYSYVSPIPSYLQHQAPELSPVSQFSSASSNDSAGSEYDEISNSKSDIDFYRERGAGIRALSLLDEAVGGVAASEPTPGGMTAKQAANRRFEERWQEKAKMKAKAKEEWELHAKRVPILVPPRRKEQMAESTRPRKPLTAEDVRDPETVAGMKCQLDIDREKWAEAKALRLMQDGFIF
jgi:hypothetical protein